MNRIFGRLLAVLNSSASFWIAVMTAVICADVFGRYFFNHPLPGVTEIIKFSVVATCWLQFAYVLREGGHIRSNLIPTRLPDNGRVLLYVVNCLAGIFIFGLIALYCWPTIIEAFVERAFEGEHPVRIPVWPIKLIVFIGAVLMTIEYIVQLVAAIRRKITPDSIDEVAPVVDLVEQFADDPEPARPAASAQSDRKDS